MRLPSFLAHAGAAGRAVQITSRGVSAASSLGRTAARRSSPRTPSSRCRPARSTPSLTRARTSPTGRRSVQARVARARTARRARRGASALVLPDSIAKVSLVRLDAVPPRAAGPRPADPLARAEVGAVPDRGGAGDLVARARARRTAGASSSSRWRGATVVREFEGACAEAGAHAGPRRSGDASAWSTRCWRRRTRRSRATGCWCTSRPTTAASSILRGRDLIFFRNRAEGSDESLPDLVHQTAMYYEDRLGGQRVRPRGGRRRRGRRGSAVAGAATSTRSGGRSKRGSACRPRRWTRSGVARFSDRIAADPALIDIGRAAGRRAGRRGAPACRRTDAPHQPLDPPVLQRAPRPARAAGAGRAGDRRADGVQIVELRLALDRHEQLLRRVGRCDERRAATLRADAERARRSVDRAQLETVAAAAREANRLIDQRTFSWTELLNRLEATLPGRRARPVHPAGRPTGRAGSRWR